MANAYTRARALLQSNLEAVREIAELLIEFETLPMEDCVEIVEELQTKVRWVHFFPLRCVVRVSAT